MTVAEIVVGLLKLVAAVAPGVLAAFGKTQSDEEAIESVRTLAEALPLQGEALDRELAERKLRG